MTKIQLLEQGLEDRKAFEGSMNRTAQQMVSLLGEGIPQTMAMTIANYTMATFVGHFHYKLDLAPDNKAPMNYIAFILAKSGAKKTSSMIKLEKALKDGYNIIQAHRIEKETLWAEENECEPRGLNPLSNALATEAGMIQRLNDFKREGIGLPALYVDEISTELASNPDMIPNIKLVAQLFDDGDAKSKPLKDKKMQSEEVHGMGMNALFIGSEHGILEDPSVLQKFMTEFISKLARRSNMVYPIFEDEEEEVTTLEALLSGVKKAKDNGVRVNKLINETSVTIARTAISNDFNHVPLSDDCSTLVTIYSMYCEEVSKLDDTVEAVQLEQQHRHWKALKLAGVYAVFNGHDEVTVNDFKEAIYAVELTGADIGNFIEKANRLPYEIMLEHFEKEGQPMTVHQLVKKNWINKPSDLKNILELANSKSGDKGMFEQDEEGFIVYNKFNEIDGLGVSYMKIASVQDLIDSGVDSTTAKNTVAQKTASGYSFKKTTFEKIGNLLRNDVAYCPFEFTNGIRKRENVIAGADFIVLDIDHTDVSDTTAHDMLADYNHIIARGSDKENPYKYRVLLPLDVNVKLQNEKWKPFIKKVAKHLGMDADLLPMSQIYFGYKGRDLLITDDGELLEASELVKNIDTPTKKIKLLKVSQIPDAWDERLDIFSNAYNAKAGHGIHNNYWYATATAHDMGFTLEQGLNLFDDILDYNDSPVRDGFRDSLRRRMTTDKQSYPRWVEEAKDAMEK